MFQLINGVQVYIGESHIWLCRTCKVWVVLETRRCPVCKRGRPAFPGEAEPVAMVAAAAGGPA